MCHVLLFRATSHKHWSRKTPVSRFGPRALPSLIPSHSENYNAEHLINSLIFQAWRSCPLSHPPSSAIRPLVPACVAEHGGPRPARHELCPPGVSPAFLDRRSLCPIYGGVRQCIAHDLGARDPCTRSAMAGLQKRLVCGRSAAMLLPLLALVQNSEIMRTRRELKAILAARAPPSEAEVSMGKQEQEQVEVNGKERTNTDKDLSIELLVRGHTTRIIVWARPTAVNTYYDRAQHLG